MVLPYDEQGDGPAIVLLHAGIADRRMWAEQLGPLAGAGHRVVALDLPGFGAAPPDPSPPWEAIRDTLDELEIERAALIGNSYGGGVALSTAVLAPERVSALILVSAAAPGASPSPQLQTAWAQETSAFEEGGIEAAVQAVLAAWTLPGAPAELRERVAAMQRRAFELEDPDLPEPVDPLDEDPSRVGELTVPTLILAGEHDMPDFLDGSARLVDRIPGARRVVIAGAGHLAPLETPEAFRALVLSFLAEG